MIRRALWRLLLEQGGWSRIWYGLATAMVIAGGGLIYHQVQPGGPVSCAQTTANIPDGPDNNGGCWPGPNNTGPNAAEGTMSNYTGACTISTANVTIDSKVIDNCGEIIVNATGFTISNSYLYDAVTINSSGSATVEDTYFKGTQGAHGTGYDCTDCGIEGDNFTILRTEIEGTNRAAWCKEVCDIEDSYIHTSHNLDPSSGAHASGVREEHYGTIRHNTIGCTYEGPYTPNPDTGCSADLTGYPDFTYIWHNTIDRNLFLGGATDNNIGFCTYGGATSGKPYSNDANNATYQVFTNNVYQRGELGTCGGYGPSTDFDTGRTGNVWSNNKYDDGTTVNP